MKALVTGAAGFIGRHLVRDLLERGHAVTALDLARPDAPGLEDARWIEADLAEAARSREVLESCDRVYHLAAAHLDQSTPSAEYHRVNVDAAVELLEAAHACGIREYVHCSTVGVYGDVKAPPADEQAAPAPLNVYERTKLEGERAVLARAGELSMPVVVIRPAWVYGPGCPRTARLLRTLRKGRFFYFGSGNNLRHPIYIDDLVAGTHLAAERGRPLAVYNLAGERAYPLREVVAAAAAALDVSAPRLRIPMGVGWLAGLAAESVFGLLRKRPPISRRSLAFFRNTNSYSIEAARRELGFAPGIGLAEGFRRSLEPEGSRSGRDSSRPVEPT